MPNRDGTGPRGQATGRGTGRGAGGGNRSGLGAEGNCVCPNCGLKMLHKTGTPCSSQTCPECGTKMVRE
jgi:DNA-directed RNA polymerase subunit RPC12/RpoP